MNDKALWEKIAAGDRAAFDGLVEEEMAGLLQAAGHEIRYYESLGDYPPGYLTPEELVGEAMVQAWRHRTEKPGGMRPRAWLYAMLFRAADALAARRREIQSHETLSTDQRVPDDPLVLDPVYDDDEEFYEWYQPDEALKWEDVLPADTVPPERIVSFCERAPAALQPVERRAALLYFRLDFDMEQVCRILGRGPEEVGPMLERARQTAAG
ncbi:MAG TPA: hypothetical protein ENK13_04145 [Thermopetrobacter sp.]|nr:hypothetical protein [Thermopetrobacter sp.]